MYFTRMSAGGLALLIAAAGCATPGPRVGEEVLMIPEGTEFSVRLEQEVSPDSREGDRLEATLIEPIATDGQIALSEGSELRGEITAVQRAGTDGSQEVDAVKLNFNEIDVDGDTYPVRTTVVEVNPEVRGDTEAGDVAAGVGAGAVAGAVLGRIIGQDDESMLIGAAIGAAAGTAIVLGTRDQHVVLPKESIMRLRLDTPLRIRG